MKTFVATDISWHKGGLGGQHHRFKGIMINGMHDSVTPTSVTVPGITGNATVCLAKPGQRYPKTGHILAHFLLPSMAMAFMNRPGTVWECGLGKLRHVASVKIACHSGNSPFGSRRVITLTAPGALKPQSCSGKICDAIRANMDTKCPCVMGISIAITQTAPNLHGKSGFR